MFDKISLKALVKYETLFPGKNAFDLFSKEHKTAIDLRDMVFVIMFTKDSAVTLDTVESLSTEDFRAQLEGFLAKQNGEAK